MVILKFWCLPVFQKLGKHIKFDMVRFYYALSGSTKPTPLAESNWRHNGGLTFSTYISQTLSEELVIGI